MCCIGVGGALCLISCVYADEFGIVMVVMYLTSESRFVNMKIEELK